MNIYKEIFLNYENIKSETEEELYYTNTTESDNRRLTLANSSIQKAFTLSLPHFLIYG